MQALNPLNVTRNVSAECSVWLLIWQPSSLTSSGRHTAAKASVTAIVRRLISVDPCCNSKVKSCCHHDRSLARRSTASGRRELGEGDEAAPHAALLRRETQGKSNRRSGPRNVPPPTMAVPIFPISGLGSSLPTIEPRESKGGASSVDHSSSARGSSGAVLGASGSESQQRMGEIE